MSDTQQAINQAEWSDPANWSGPKLFGLYSSRADTRAWVPKRTPGLGWTLNLGHGKARAVFAVILAGVTGCMITACVLGVILLRLALAGLRHM